MPKMLLSMVGPLLLAAAGLRSRPSSPSFLHQLVCGPQHPPNTSSSAFLLSLPSVKNLEWATSSDIKHFMFTVTATGELGPVAHTNL